MDRQTISPPATHAPARPAGITAYLGAAAFVVAAGWYSLATKGITVASAPQVGAGVPPARAERIFFHWLVTTLAQERFYSVIGIAAFACLAVTAVLGRRFLGPDSALAKAGAFAAGAGAAAWAVSAVIELGGHRAVGLMATHRNPIQVTNSIAFTIDLIGQAFALTAFALIGAGMLAFAWIARQQGRRAWAGGTLLARSWPSPPPGPMLPATAMSPT